MLYKFTEKYLQGHFIYLSKVQIDQLKRSWSSKSLEKLNSHLKLPKILIEKCAINIFLKKSKYTPDLQIVQTLSGNLGSGSKKFCETRQNQAFELALFMCCTCECAHTCPKTLPFYSRNLSLDRFLLRSILWRIFNNLIWLIYVSFILIVSNTQTDTTKYVYIEPWKVWQNILRSTTA